MFFMTTVLVLYGAGRWPLPAVALVVGLATAVRPVGVALLIPLTPEVMRRSASRAAAAQFALLLPMATWGLAAYMLYLWAEFDDPIAFAQTQTHWRVNRPLGPTEKAAALLTGRPLLDVFTPSAPGYWGSREGHSHLLFNWYAANVLLAVFAVGYVAVGAARRWLTWSEAALAAALLAIPYLTKGYELSMQSFGRFVLVVPPLYLVAGRLLHQSGGSAAAAALGVSAAFLVVYAALHAARYRVF